MTLAGICTGTTYCHLVLVDWQGTSKQCKVIASRKITTPSSFSGEGAILDYYRAEVETFLTSTTVHTISIENGGSWVIEFQKGKILDKRRISLRIEGVVLSAIYRYLGAELEQLRKRSIFSAKRLGRISITDIGGVKAITGQSNEYTCRAIAAALASSMG